MRHTALNTFIDDLFAFVIKMPLLHRLACLRDDVVFLVYLYQKWIYPEDKRRRNEFGQVGDSGAQSDDEEEDLKLVQEDEEVTKTKATLLVKESKDEGDDAPRERRARGKSASPAKGSLKDSAKDPAKKKDL